MIGRRVERLDQFVNDGPRLIKLGKAGQPLRQGNGENGVGPIQVYGAQHVEARPQLLDRNLGPFG